MEIKIDLDIEEIIEDCIDNEDNFRNQLRESILFSIKQQVLQSISKELLEDLRKEVEKDMPNLVAEHFGNWLKEWRFTSCGKEVNVREYLESIFRNNTAYLYGTSIESYIKNFAEKFSTELKNKYDLSFAALIVKNMADQKLLCDDKLAELVKQ